LQDHLRIGTHDLDHPISCQCKKHRQLARQEGGFASCFPQAVLMFPSSSITVATDGERLTCIGFSLGEPVRLGNFEFSANYFSGMSLSPRGSGEGAIFVGSTRSGASTPQQATTEDSTEEYLMTSSGEGGVDHLSPRRCSTGTLLTPTSTTTWKEAPSRMRFPLRTAVPWPETNYLFERRHHE
jgi:hypothetical protein